eukprot:scaffold97995_cov19-Prasinocladus_malaysianus.AAC.1
MVPLDREERCFGFPFANSSRRLLWHASHASKRRSPAHPITSACGIKQAGPKFSEDSKLLRAGSKHLSVRFRLHMVAGATATNPRRLGGCVQPA